MNSLNIAENLKKRIIDFHSDRLILCQIFQTLRISQHRKTKISCLDQMLGNMERGRFERDTFLNTKNLQLNTTVERSWHVDIFWHLVLVP